MKKILLLLLTLVVGLTAQATVTETVTFTGQKRSNGNTSYFSWTIQSIWGDASLPPRQGSSYTFSDVVLQGGQNAHITLNGTLNFQESTSMTDVVTGSTFTVTIESSSLWFYGATVKTLSGTAVSGCSATASSDNHTLTVTIPSGKTFGYIYVDYVPNEPFSSINTVISGVDASYIYQGSAIEPVPVVTYNGTTLTKGTDYTVSYSSSNNVGTATLTVTGTGNYAGTVTRSYTIRNIALSDFNSLGNNTYEIATTTDLDNLALLVDIAANNCNGITFKQTADIAYSTAGLGDTDTNFTAIGGYFNGSDKNFSGTYDGQGHTISGIRLYKPLTNQNVNKNQALFGRAVNATIKNVTLTDARITGYRIVAGLVGNCSSTTVQNCLVLNSTVTCGDTYVGAVIGQNNSGTYTANYYRDCTVNGTAGATNVGVGGNGGVSVSSDRSGVRSAHTLTLPDGVTATGESVTIGGMTYYAANTTVTLNYNVPVGYVESCSVNGTAITGNTFTMPSQDATVTMTTTAIDYTITLPTNLEHGTVTSDKATAHIGETVTLTVTTYDGYTVGSVTVMNGNTPVQVTAGTNGTYTFTMPAANVTVNVVLDSPQYSFDSNTGVLTLIWGEFNKDHKWGSDVTASAVKSVTATSEVSFTGDCQKLFSSFTNCESMDLRNVNTAGMTNAYMLFSSNSSLTSLDLSGWNTASVTSMSYMFAGCSGLTSLNLSGWNTGIVTNMSYMFYKCSGLTSLDLSGWNTGNVTNMSYMFSDCSSLTSLDLSGFNTGNVTDMKYMFDGCSGLTSLDLSGFNTGNVTNMSYMFSDCWRLTTIYAGTGWNTEKVTSSNRMFDDCRKLMGGMGTRFNSSHIDKEYACIDGGSSSPGYLSDPNALPRYTFDSETGVLALLWSEFNKDYKWGYDVTPSEVKSVTATSEVSFTGNCTVLFQGFTNCESMDLTNVNTDSLTNMSYMFYNCSGLTSLDLSAWNTANVYDMCYMFLYCSDLTSLKLSGWNTENVEDMSYMFNGCSSLTSLDLSGWDTENVEDMSYMFSDCSSLTSLNLSGFNTASVAKMSGMFSGCSGLTSLNLSGWNTANVYDMSGMFSGCSGLTTIYVGEGWSTGFLFDSENMFYDCTSLKGGMGTTYDASHIDEEYAHIDGGPDNPGYFTDANAVMLLPGDVNGDNKVDVSDVNIIINIILGKAQASSYPGISDLNNDNKVDVSDVNAVINIILGKE